jgi:tetraacyldisaccharide-1-P 4'-kinase
MSEQSFVYRCTMCPSFEDVVQIFLSERHSRVLDEYRSILHNDPEYLLFHSTSTALKLQFQLKCDDLPLLSIGGCIEGGSGECCVVHALQEAFRRRDLRAH